MLYWIIYLIVGLAIAASWIMLGRAILRGQLRLRNGGVLRRSEKPGLFWLSIAAMLLGSLAAVSALFFVLIPMLHVAQAAKELEGKWRVVSGSDNDKPIPEGQGQGGLWIFTGNKLTTTGPKDADGHVDGPDEFRFSLDASAQPPALDLIYFPHPARFGAGVEVDRVKAIYKLEGDTLTIAMRPPYTLQFDRPTQFEHKQGKALSVIVLKRVGAAE